MRIRIVDAFTDRPFAGNPAGVVLLESAGEFPDAAWMQRVAAEVNLSETAFAHPLADTADADWALRWFTPAAEVRLCGHATLATAHVLLGGAAGGTGAGGTVRFATLSGVLSVRPAGGGALTMDFPAAPPSEVPAPDGLADALGAEPVSAHATGDLGHLLVELADEEAVRGLRPDPAAVAALGWEVVQVTAAPADPGAGYDYVVRVFAPADGVPEDPVTGSAHTALAPYWAARADRTDLTGYQASARGGYVRAALRGDRVELTGHAVTVIDGDLLTAP